MKAKSDKFLRQLPLCLKKLSVFKKVQKVDLKPKTIH